MYAKVITWRLGESVRSAESYPRFLQDLAQRNVAALRRFGLLDGFVIRTGQDTIMTVNLYETAEQAETAWGAMVGTPAYAKSVDLELIDRVMGQAEDLPLLLTPD